MYVMVVLLFFFSSRRRHTRCALVTGVQTCALPILFVEQRACPVRREGAARRAANLIGVALPHHVGVWKPVQFEVAVLAPEFGQAGQRLAEGHALRAHTKTIVVDALRSEEHTSELQSLMRSSYAVFCLKKKK